MVLRGQGQDPLGAPPGRSIVLIPLRFHDFLFAPRQRGDIEPVPQSQLDDDFALVCLVEEKAQSLSVGVVPLIEVVAVVVQLFGGEEIPFVAVKHGVAHVVPSHRPHEVEVFGQVCPRPLPEVVFVAGAPTSMMGSLLYCQ